MARDKEEQARIQLILDGKNANSTLRDLEAAARKVRAELRGMNPDSAEFGRTRASLERINRELDQTRVRAGLAKSNMSKMLSEIKTTFIGNLGANLATVGLGKISDFFVNSWEAAKRLSDQMADIQRTTGLTADEVKSLNSELGKIDTRTSMSDLREIAVVAGQFGVAKNQIRDFVEAVDQLNVAMGMEFQGGAEEVATEMSKLRNIFTDIKSNDISTDLKFISNAMLVLAQSGVATGPVMADFANRIGGYGIQIGLTSGQVLGLSATLQELNVSAERGGTAVVKILQKMLTESESFAQIAGMEINQFKELLNKDLFGAFTKVMEGSKQLGPNATGLAKIIKDLEVQGAGASEVFAKLGSNTDLLNQRVDLANKSITTTNSLSEQAALKQDNFAGAVDRLSKSWERLTANPAIAGFFKVVVDGAAKAIELINNAIAFSTGNFQEKVNEFAINAGNNLKKDQNEKIAGIKAYHNQFNSIQLKAILDRREESARQELADLKSMNKANDSRLYNQKFARAKESAAILNNLRDLIKQKEAIEKNKGSIPLPEPEKKLTEPEKKAIRDRAKEEADLFTKEMYTQIDALRQLREMETGLTITDDDVDAEIKRLQENAKNWEDFYNEIAAYEKEANEKSLRESKEKSRQKMQDANEYASAVTSSIGSVMQVWDVSANNELQRERKKNNQKKAELARQLESNLISQEQYNAKLAALDLQQESQEREAARKQAERQKQAAIFEAIIKTTLAWIEAAIDPTGISYARAAAASVQLGALIATPLPEFYDGGFTGAGGKMDSKGGFPAILHRNEYVINERLMKNPVVSAFTEEMEAVRTGKKNEVNTQNSSSSQVVVQSDPEVKKLLQQLLNNGVKGVWDWDYEQRSDARMSEIESRRKF